MEQKKEPIEVFIGLSRGDPVLQGGEEARPFY
jgi:hypothetical protein